jgi:hypothetical protein
MIQFTTKNGSREVVSCANDEHSTWTSYLYVDNGELITPTCAKHKTKAGAMKWAKKILSRYGAMV